MSDYISSIVAALIVFIVVFFVGIALFNDMKCIEQGYQKGRLTISMDRYCIGIKDGNSVTVKQ